MDGLFDCTPPYTVTRAPGHDMPPGGPQTALLQCLPAQRRQGLSQAHLPCRSSGHALARTGTAAAHCTVPGCLLALTAPGAPSHRQVKDQKGLPVFPMLGVVSMCSQKRGEGQWRSSAAKHLQKSAGAGVVLMVQQLKCQDRRSQDSVHRSNALLLKTCCQCWRRLEVPMTEYWSTLTGREECHRLHCLVVLERPSW